MARYLQIDALQPPFPFEVDGNNRIMFSCNFAVLGVDINDLCHDLATLLINDAVVSALGTDIFIGPNAVIPASAGDVGPFTHIIPTGGMATDRTHNGDRYERPTVQFVTRSNNYQVALERAVNIWRSLDGRYNVTV